MSLAVIDDDEVVSASREKECGDSEETGLACGRPAAKIALTAPIFTGGETVLQ